MTETWLKQHTCREFSAMTEIFVNGRSLLIMDGILRLFMPQLVREMQDWNQFDVSIDDRPLLGNGVDSLIVIVNLFDYWRDPYYLFMRPDHTYINVGITTLLCVRKFIDKYMPSPIEGSIAEKYIADCIEFLESSVRDHYPITAIEFLEKARQGKEKFKVEMDFKRTTELLINKLGVGENYYVPVTDRIECTNNGKTAIPQTGAATKNIFNLFRLLVNSRGAFKMRRFGDECEIYAKMLGMNQYEISYFKK